jgi:hypothetical protein
VAVTATPEGEEMRIVEATTDADGGFRMRLYAGQYRVSFRLADGLTQCAPRSVEATLAKVFTVAADGEVVVEETLLPTGTMSGRFFLADGGPLVAARVTVETPGGTQVAHVSTGADGAVSIGRLFAGPYVVVLTGYQYVRGELTRERADVVTVAPGRHTIVEDRLLPTGTVRVTARDARTGRAVADFCVDLAVGNSPRIECSSGGVATFQALNIPVNHPTTSSTIRSSPSRNTASAMDDKSKITFRQKMIRTIANAASAIRVVRAS